MKKTIFFAVLMFFAVAFATSAQTYCFKIIEMVQNGVKSKYDVGYTYFTFQDGKNQFYVSDANGYSTSSTPLVYKLVSTANGMYKYQQQGPMGPIGNYYTFNSDFTRANSTSVYTKGVVVVSKRVNGPEENTEEFY